MIVPPTNVRVLIATKPVDFRKGAMGLAAIVEARPQCQVRWLDAPHMLLETHPDEAAKAIDEFCVCL